jgi:hypothetical protein
VRGGCDGRRTHKHARTNSGHTSIMHCDTKKERETDRSVGRIAWYFPFSLGTACISQFLRIGCSEGTYIGKLEVEVEEGYVQTGSSQVEPLNAQR